MTSSPRKICPRCKKADLTDFKSCRFCQTPYDYRKPPSSGNKFAIGTTGIIVLTLAIGIPMRNTITKLLVGTVISKSGSDIEEADKTLAADSTNYDALLKRAKAYDALGTYYKSEPDYTAAIAIRPKEADLYRRRAVCYDALDKGDLAKKDRETADSLGH